MDETILATGTEFEQLKERIAHLEEENQRLEEALRRNAKIFEQLLVNGDQGIALTGPDRRIVRVIRGLTGVEPDSLVGTPVEWRVAEEDRPAVIDAYRKLLERTCQKVQLVVRIPHADRKVAVYSVTLTDMLENPDIQGIVWNYAAYPCAGKGSWVCDWFDTHSPEIVKETALRCVSSSGD